MTDKNKMTTSEMFGYTQEDFYALVDAAVKIYYEHVVLSNDKNPITKKEIYDLIEKESKTMKDVFVITSTMKNIEIAELCDQIPLDAAGKVE